MSDDIEAKIQAAVHDPQNVGEMSGADAIGTVGSENCGDMLRMWVKFKEEDGHKVIDKRGEQTQETPDPKIKLSLEKVPFWQALDTVLDAASLRHSVA